MWPFLSLWPEEMVTAFMFARGSHMQTSRWPFPADKAVGKSIIRPARVG